eukprot:2366540-Pleurochrysis_carterae.AAC.1
MSPIVPPERMSQVCAASAPDASALRFCWFPQRTAQALYFRRSPFSSFFFLSTHIISITSEARFE